MRRFFPMALSFLSLSLLADISEESLYEYLISKGGASREEIVQDERNIADAIKEASRPVDREALRALELQLRSEELKVSFSGWVANSLRTRFDSEKELKDLAGNGGLNANHINEYVSGLRFTSSDKNKSLPSSLEKTLSGPKEVASFSVGRGYPFKIHQHLDVKLIDGKHVLVSYSTLSFDASIPRDSWPTDLKNRFKNLSDSDIEKVINEEMNPKFRDSFYKIANLNAEDSQETLVETRESRVTTDGNTVRKTESVDHSATVTRLSLPSSVKSDEIPDKVRAHLHKDTYGASRGSAINEAALEFASRKGAKNKEFTEIWSLQEEINRQKDQSAREQKLNDLKAKYELAKAVRSNPKLVDNKEPCEVIVGIIGPERFSKLSNTNQSACDEYIKKQQETKLAAEKEAQAKQQEEERVKSQTNNFHAQFMSLVNYCMSRSQMQAQQQQTSPIEQIVRPLYNQLQRQGFGCTYFGKLAGDLSSDTFGTSTEDAFLQEMFGGFGMTGVEVDSVMGDKAFDVVKRSAPDTDVGTKKLLEERQCLEKMESLAGFSLQMIAGSAGVDSLPMEALQNPQIRQMVKSRNAAKALIAAIDSELTVRSQRGGGRTQSMNASMGQAAGMAAPNARPTSRQGVRVQSSGQSYINRGIQTQAPNGAGANRVPAGLGGSNTAPQFLGN